MIPLVTDTWDCKELQAIQNVVDSNRFTMGEQVKQFEDEFAKMHGVKHAICVNSGSSANLISVAAAFFHLGLKPGDEVIVPTIGWSTTYSPLFYLGLTPSFVDVGIDNLNIDVTLIEKAITPKTKLIFIVNLLGRPCELEKISEICERRGLALLEDNCEAMGSYLGSKKSGTFGLAGTFSFFFSHHITTIEGGMVITNDTSFSDYCRSLRAHGWTRELNKDSHLFDDSVSEFKRLFWFPVPGFNVRPTEFTGAIGIEQLKKFPEMLQTRVDNYKLLETLLQGFNSVDLLPYSEGHSAFSLAFICKSSSTRDKIILALKENQVATRPIASGDMLSQPMLEYFNSYRVTSKSEVSKRVDDVGFMIGNHPKPMRDEFEFLYRILIENGIS